MHRLADAGLTNREACYNTVRNVTACSLAGIARDEVFDVRPYAQKLAYAFLRKDLTGNLPRKFKIAFDGCAGTDCITGAINDVGLRAVIRDGKRGFRMVVGGGLGPLPVEAQLLDEFLPEERLLNRIEAVIRVFNRYGNRKNKNTARMKFLVRERGFAWLKEQIEKEYHNILANGGIAWPEMVPEGFGGYQSNPQPLGDGALLPVVNPQPSGDAGYDAWLEHQRHGAAPDRLRRGDREGGTGQSYERAVARRRADRRHCRRWPGARDDRSESAAGVHSAGSTAAGLRGAARGESGRFGREPNRRRHHLPRLLLLQPGRSPRR